MFEKHWLEFYARYSASLTSGLSKISFSLGDIYILCLGMLLLMLSVRLLRAIINRQARLLKRLFHLLLFCALVYLQFLLSWGLNYSYRSFSHEQGLQPLQSNEGITALAGYLAAHCALERRCMPGYHASTQQADSLQEVLDSASAAFKKGEPILNVKNVSPICKPSLTGESLNYLSTLGYFNPFTLEAQVNTRMPRVLLGFTCCHEMAHQAGYGFEYEASLVAYLIATHSTNRELRYSAYFSALEETLPELYHRDSLLYRREISELDPLVRADIKLDRQFSKKYRGPVSFLSGIIYSQYLKANKQPQGLQSYSDFVPLLISWYRKHGYD